MDGLFPFEFSQGIRREFGVVSALWGRLKGSCRNSTRIFIPAYLSALWGIFRVFSRTTETHSRFCIGVCVMDSGAGLSGKPETHRAFLRRNLRYGAVPGAQQKNRYATPA